MFNRFKRYGLLATLLGTGLSHFPAVSLAGSEADATSGPLHVIELFTSQGCYSCPPADEYLSDLINGDESVVALEFHVDYWDQLVYGAAGSWVDPFSSPEYTNRQRHYNNRSLGGRKGVYTPQIIVDGRYAAVGSDRKRVNQQLNNTLPPAEIALSVSRSSTNELELTMNNPSQQPTTVWLVTYDLHQKTEITAGENKNLTIDNHHVVKSVKALQTYSRDDAANASLLIPIKLAEGEGCSVLAQEDLTGPIHGAVNCPRS